MNETIKPNQSEKTDNWDLALEVFFQQTHLHCERCKLSRSVKPSVIGDSWGIIWGFLFNRQSNKLPKISNNH